MADDLERYRIEIAGILALFAVSVAIVQCIASGSQRRRRIVPDDSLAASSSKGYIINFAGPTGSCCGRGTKMEDNPMKRLNGLAPASLLGAAVLLSILGLSSMAGAEPLKVRFEWLAHVHHSWFHLADQRGWYKDEGLDVTFEDGTGSVVTTQLVGAGKYEIGLATHAPAIVGMVKGIPVKAIASFARTSIIGVVVPKGSGWKSPKDLVDNNVKIVSTSGGFEQPFLEAFFLNAGTDIKKASILRVGAANLWSTYINKQADAMISGPAYDLPYMASARPSEGFTFTQFGLKMPGLGLIANNKAIADRPDDIRKFVKVTLGAFEYVINGHVEEGIAALVKARPDADVDAAVARGQIANYRPLYVTEATKDKPLGYMGPSDWADGIKNMKAAGVVPASMKAEDFYTNEFIPGM